MKILQAPTKSTHDIGPWYIMPSLTHPHGNPLEGQGDGREREEHDFNPVSISLPLL